MSQFAIFTVAFHYEGDYAKEYSDKFVFLVPIEKKTAAKEIISKTAASYRRDYIYGKEDDINNFLKVVDARLKAQNIQYSFADANNIDINLWD